MRENNNCTYLYQRLPFADAAKVPWDTPSGSGLPTSVDDFPGLGVHVYVIALKSVWSVYLCTAVVVSILTADGHRTSMSWLLIGGSQINFPVNKIRLTLATHGLPQGHRGKERNHRYAHPEKVLFAQKEPIDSVNSRIRFFLEMSIALKSPSR